MRRVNILLEMQLCIAKKPYLYRKFAAGKLKLVFNLYFCNADKAIL